MKGLARAAGRNNATFQPTPEGTSPIMSMFLWDGIGCWGEDVDGDGSLDIDADYDADVVLHEYHHGVSHRLNTSFTGAEANAMGEGGSDFFAYTVNGDTILAGLRAARRHPQHQREDVRRLDVPADRLLRGTRQRRDLGERAVGHSRALSNGSRARERGRGHQRGHQLYVDALKLSPPSPTMLDMRDAMLLVDSIRNPGVPRSQNFCALWESFAVRGMGVNATDTHDNGSNQVGANFAGPSGCNAPPAPMTVSVSASPSTANEAGPADGAFIVRRSEATASALVVNVAIGGTAIAGSDYQPILTVVTIPPDALSVAVPVTPIDDPTIEVNESVVLTLGAGTGYLVGTPSTATVSIVSDDAPPDLVVSTLTAPAHGGPGLTMDVDDTTRNQGTGASLQSSTSFYLSLNNSVDAADTLLGTRPVPALTAGVNDLATTPLTIPQDTVPGIYRIVAKADGPSQLVETSESNNTRAVIVRIGPDLTVTTLSVPANIAAGVPFTASYTLSNAGGSVGGASNTRFYLSTDLTVDPADTPLQAQTVSPIDPGVPVALTFNLAAPSNTVGGLDRRRRRRGRRPAGRRVHRDEQRPIRVDARRPGFASGDSDRSDAGVRGQQLQRHGIDEELRRCRGWFVADRVLPVGERTARRERCSAQRLAAGRRAPARRVEPGDAHDHASCHHGRRRLVHHRERGRRERGRRVDREQQRQVRHRERRARSDGLVRVRSGHGNSGDIDHRDGHRQELGIDPAGASTNRYYLSVNAAFDAGDTPLAAERPVLALLPNGIHTGSTIVAIPAGLSGRHYVLIVSDGYGAVAEAAENNNVRAVVVTINP